MEERIHAALPAYLAAAQPRWVQPAVEGLTSINTGWESDVYAFTLAHGPAGERARERLILRLYPGDSAERVAHREAYGMRALWRAGYPLPEVYATCLTDSPLGRPFMVMTFVEGEILWEQMVRATDAAAQEALLEGFCQAFVRLHRLDWRIVAREEQIPRYEADQLAAIDDTLSLGRRIVGEWDRPEFAPVFAWLNGRRRELRRTLLAPVHLDLHPGNVILRPDGQMTVIDWTQIQAADRRFDLAWTALLVESHASTEWRDRVVNGYTAVSGHEVAEDFELFEVFSAAKRLATFAVTMSQGAGRLNMRPGAEAMIRASLPAMRRVYAILCARTDLRLPEVEELLASLT